ncbi:unnamed protein product [Vitrella brassicaformis CCMP3155]|uniref:Uncharacterized protein n=2 Tax=Vitrella brassicaformis TaxID=1169539 RepID=A0A0G4GMK4_VITBC|nr:unnamed protein product [Vitrella brassicaformis CCMP3155]|eukprot:CEM31416.1 unnamed protein product [Vitrella brassicaformis CCMP3155]
MNSSHCVTLEDIYNDHKDDLGGPTSLTWREFWCGCLFDPTSVEVHNMEPDIDAIKHGDCDKLVYDVCIEIYNAEQNGRLES